MNGKSTWTPAEIVRIKKVSKHLQLVSLLSCNREKDRETNYSILPLERLLDGAAILHEPALR